jgi:hypothetical protein
MSHCDGRLATETGIRQSNDVVEIGLLLPTSWADALMEMSKRRRQSVGTILRGMIDRAIVDDLSNRS